MYTCAFVALFLLLKYQTPDSIFISHISATTKHFLLCLTLFSYDFFASTPWTCFTYSPLQTLGFLSMDILKCLLYLGTVLASYLQNCIYRNYIRCFFAVSLNLH